MSKVQLRQVGMKKVDWKKVGWRQSDNTLDFPSGAILHYDADIDPYVEQLYGPHTFNYSILSPQYQRNADGSYSNVGAKPAVDVFDGEKWLRSCGDVTNLANTDTTFTAQGTTPPTVTNNTTHLGVACHAITFTPSNTSLGYAGCRAVGKYAPITELLTYTGSYAVSISRPLVGEEKIVCYWTGVTALQSTDISVGNSSAFFDQYGLISTTHTVTSGRSGPVYPTLFLSNLVTSDLTVYVHSAQLTQTSYPVPYVPPGVTQPASNATTTNGSWFSLPDGSPLWKALTGQPLTLATRVMMGVGSGDISTATFNTLSCSDAAPGRLLLYYSGGSPGRLPRSFDGVTGPFVDLSWARNATIRQFVQVNTAGTQFRVGYMVEGTHTTIQWGSWSAFDGSLNPTTLYRFMLGYTNPHPMWYNKITAWKKQATDAEILEAMA